MVTTSNVSGLGKTLLERFEMVQGMWSEKGIMYKMGYQTYVSVIESIHKNNEVLYIFM